MHGFVAEQGGDAGPRRGLDDGGHFLAYHAVALGLGEVAAQHLAGAQDDDLLRLQRIRLFRALDFSLEDVRALLDAPDAELRSALVSQRAALLAKLEETQSLVTIIDRVLDGTPTDTQQEDKQITVNEMFKDFRNDEFAREAEERWGSTDAWKEAKRRVVTYDLDDWKVMAVEATALNDALLAHMTAGDSATAPAVVALAEEHR